MWPIKSVQHLLTNWMHAVNHTLVLSQLLLQILGMLSHHTLCRHNTALADWQPTMGLVCCHIRGATGVVVALWPTTVMMIQIYLPMHSSGFGAAPSLSLLVWGIFSLGLWTRWWIWTSFECKCMVQLVEVYGRTWVQVYGTAGMDNKISVWDYKVQLYSSVICWALHPLQDFSRVIFSADSTKVLQMRL